MAKLTMIREDQCRLDISGCDAAWSNRFLQPDYTAGSIEMLDPVTRHVRIVEIVRDGKALADPKNPTVPGELRAVNLWELMPGDIGFMSTRFIHASRAASNGYVDSRHALVHGEKFKDFVDGPTVKVMLGGNGWQIGLDISDITRKWPDESLVKTVTRIQIPQGQGLRFYPLTAWYWAREMRPEVGDNRPVVKAK